MIGNSIEGLINLAVQGFGIIEAPREFVTLRTNELVEILPQLDSPVIDIYFIYSKSLENSKKIRAFAEYVEKHILNKHS